MKAVIVFSAICIAIAFAVPLQSDYVAVDSRLPYQTVHSVHDSYPVSDIVPPVHQVHPAVRYESQDRPQSQIIAFQNDNDGDGTYNFA